MTAVRIDPIPRAPILTGNYDKDMLAMHDWMKAITRTATQLRERTGGATDMIAATTSTAATAAATASASQAGAVIPTDGGAVTLTPADPLSSTSLNTSDARIDVAGHTRTGAGAPLIAASVVESVARGAAYYVYYVDAANAGGAQTFLATTELSTVTGTANYRIVGSIYVADASYIERKIAGEV